MVDTVDSLAEKLLAMAIAEGRSEYVTALQNIVPASVTSTLTKLVADVSNFDETWKAKIFRNDYDNESIRLMFSDTLVVKKDWQDFLLEIASAVTEKNTQYAMFKNSMKSGLYDVAEAIVKKVDDIADLTHWLSTTMSRYIQLKGTAYQALTGKESQFSRSAARVLDLIGVEIQDDFNGTYESSNNIWSHTKFAAAVDWVSEIASAPKVVLDKEGSPYISNSLIVQAFCEERLRVEAKGEWHSDTFPKLVPVLAEGAAADAMIKRGEIPLEPVFIANGTTDIPTHTFMAPGQSAEDIAKALTFMSYETIGMARDNLDLKIFLLEHKTSIPYTREPKIPDDLRVAMKNHRPEFLSKSFTRNLLNFEYCEVQTHAYLRGMEIQFSQNNSLKIERHLLSDDRLLGALRSKAELDYLSSALTGAPSRAGDERRTNFIYGQVGQAPSTVEAFIGAYKRLMGTIGHAPNAYFQAEESFLHELAEQFTKENIPVSNYNSTWYSGNPTANAVTDSQNRLNTRLGVLSYSKIRDMTVDEAFTKAVRLKPGYEVNALCGLMDRISVEELASRAKTPAQRAFVITNFDVKKHYAKMPKAIRMAIGGKILEEDLGM